MTQDYYLVKEKFDKLRSFINGWGKPGTSELMILESIPGINQSRLHLIRYIIDSGKVDDYGKPLSEKRFVLIEESGPKKCEYMYNVHSVSYGGNITICGTTIGYEFIPVDDIDVFFKEKYYDDILMRLRMLSGLDKKNKDAHDIIFSMIKEIIKE